MESLVNPVKLLEALRSKFPTQWLEPKEIPGEKVVQVDWVSNPGLINFFNPGRPALVQILGESELVHLQALADRPDLLDQAIPIDTLAIVFCSPASPPEFLSQWRKKNRKDVAFIAAEGSPDHIISFLYEGFALDIAHKTTLHGVFLSIFGQGVMVTGKPSIGKSEIALEMLGRGHKFVADDLVEFVRMGHDSITGTCPKIIRDMIEVRSLGIVNIRRLFGNHVVLGSQELNFIVILFTDNNKLIERDRSRPLEIEPQKILDVEIPVFPIQVRAGRNLATLIETCTRAYLVRKEHHYDAVSEIMERQEKLLE